MDQKHVLSLARSHVPPQGILPVQPVTDRDPVQPVTDRDASMTCSAEIARAVDPALHTAYGLATWSSCKAGPPRSTYSTL
jgi:hypothetical protein